MFYPVCTIIATNRLFLFKSLPKFMSISIQNVYIFTLLNEGNSITMHKKMCCKSRVMNQKSDNLNPIFILYPSPVFGLTLLKSQSSFYFFSENFLH